MAHTSLVNAGLRRTASNEDAITAAVERQPCRGPRDNAQKIRTIANGGHQRLYLWENVNYGDSDHYLQVTNARTEPYRERMDARGSMLESAGFFALQRSVPPFFLTLD